MPAAFLDGTVDTRYLLAAIILIFGLFGGYFVGQFNRRVLARLGVGDAVEGTSLERTARNFGTDTVTILARSSAWIIYIVAIAYSLEVADIIQTQVLLSQGLDLLPSYILAALIIMGGLLVADKVQISVQERLKGIKFPEMGLVGRILRYTVIFVAILLALAQIGVAIGVLLILLGAYLFTFIVLVVTALHQLLAAGGSGLYLVLTQPFVIGDRVMIGEREGVVQEVNIFTTSLEQDGRVFIVPNHLVFKNGVTLIRE